VSADGEAKSRPYRGVVFGAGGIARTAHLPAFQQLGDRLQIVAAIDPDPAARALDGLPLLRDRAMIDQFGPIDFVDICTPTSSHLPLALWALDAGYHVVCEKPVALDRAQALTLTEAAARSGKVVVPCHQYRFNPAWQQMGAWLRAGAIGRWHVAELSVYRMAADVGSGRGVPWRTVAQGEHGTREGGILLDHGTHLLYSVVDLGGMPSGVRCWTGRLKHHAYAVEDTVQLTLEYPDRLATLFLTWAASHRENRVRFIGETGTIDWQGGILRLERGDAVETHDFSVQLDKKSYAGWFASLFGTFADAMDRGAAPDMLADVTRVAAVLEAAFASASSGCRVAVTA
jgi:predicted dehydrogenase